MPNSGSKLIQTKGAGMLAAIQWKLVLGDKGSLKYAVLSPSGISFFADMAVDGSGVGSAIREALGQMGNDRPSIIRGTPDDMAIHELMHWDEAEKYPTDNHSHLNITSSNTFTDQARVIIDALVRFDQISGNEKKFLKGYVQNYVKHILSDDE